MKRSHNYSSSDSELDDNVDVEKDSGDENRCDHHATPLIYAFIDSPQLKVALHYILCSDLWLFSSPVRLIPTARCHLPQPPKFKPERGAEGYVN